MTELVERHSFRADLVTEAHLGALKLIAPEQHALVLAYYGGSHKTYKQIAWEFDISIGTVKSRLNRAKYKLNKWKAEEAAHGQETYQEGTNGIARKPASQEPLNTLLVEGTGGDTGLE